MRAHRLAVFLFAAVAITQDTAAQTLTSLQPGDSIQFRPALGSRSPRRAGRLISVDRSTLTVQHDGLQSSLPFDALVDLQVRRTIENPGGRGALHGAIVGGSILGTAGLWLGICNPASQWDPSPGFCARSAEPSDVLMVVGAGAFGGAIIGSMVGAIVAPTHEWRFIAITRDAATDIGITVPVERSASRGRE